MRLIDAGHLYDEVEKLKESPWFNDDTNGARIIRREALNIVEDLCICKEPTVCDIEQIRAEIEQIEPYDLPWDKRTPEHIRDMALEIVEKYAEQEPTEDYEYEIECLQKRLDIAEYDKERLKEKIKALEQEPCDDAVSRKDAEQMFRNIRCHLKPQDYKSAEEFNTRDLMLLNAEQLIHALPSVTQKSTECEDAVSRQAVLDLAEKGILVSNGNYKSVCKEINELPPARPLEQTGHWIDHQKGRWIYAQCSECGEVHDSQSDYCPNCGVRMVEPQESEDKE